MDKETYLEKLEREHKEETRLAEAALADCRKALEPFMTFFPGDVPNPSVTPILAQLLRDIDHGTQNEGSKDKVPDRNEFFWLMEHYLGHYVQANLEDIRWLADWCKQKGYREENPYHCWGSYYIFYEPSERNQVLVILTQQRNYLLVCPTDPHSYHTLFVRRIWETRDPNESDDGGMDDYWSDNTAESPWVHKPDLHWYRQDQFQIANDPASDNGTIVDFEYQTPSRHWILGPQANGLHRDGGLDLMLVLSTFQNILQHVKEEEKNG